jgi:hypothetical protein
MKRIEIEKKNEKIFYRENRFTHFIISSQAKAGCITTTNRYKKHLQSISSAKKKSNEENNFLTIASDWMTSEPKEILSAVNN